MNLDALATELAKPEYASMSDQEAADVINAKTVTVRRLVETWRVKQYAIEQGIWATLKLARENTELPNELRGLCISILDWVDDSAGKIQTVDMDLPSVQYMLQSLVAVPLATQEQVNAILAMGSVTVAWTTHNSLPEIGRGLVANIRRENT
jgi:hypothetical protein